VTSEEIENDSNRTLIFSAQLFKFCSNDTVYLSVSNVCFLQDLNSNWTNMVFFCFKWHRRNRRQNHFFIYES